jgi:putative ABC transport system permease protein
MENLLKDMRYGLRMLAKNPGFTLIAIITLALGIGANTAIFSVVNAVVLKPLPYAKPDRLFLMWGANSKDGNQQQLASLADYLDFKKQASSFSELSAVCVPFSFVLSGGGEPEQIQGQYTSANLFSALGVGAALGRTYLEEEDTASGAPVVVLSHGLWQRYFGADPEIVGKSLTLSGSKMTIIGVMPAGFQFLDAAQLYLPLGQNPVAARGRGVRLLSVVGLLGPESTPEQARAEVKAIAGRLAQQYPDTNTDIGARLVPLQEQVTSKVRPALLILLGAVGFVLLIACANVANLMLARAAARRREVAIRAALGAGRARLVRQMLTESIVLSVVGGAAGVLLAAWGIDLLMALAPSQIPRYNPIGIDSTVLGFTLGVAVITGILFGLAPALQASKLDLQSALKEGGRGAIGDGGQRRVRSLLVVAEMAVALVLLVGAGLLIRSFVELLRVDPGYNTSNVLTTMILLPQSSYGQPAQRLAFAGRLEERLKALPEVTSVGVVTRLPLFSALNNSTSFMAIEGRPLPPGQHPEVDFRRASTGYFQTLGIPLHAGRLVTEQDITSNTPAVVINEAMARRFWPDEDPVGKRISATGSNPEQGPWQTIVGVVGNVRHLGLDIEPRPEVYFHMNTSPFFSPIFAIRTTGDPKNLVAAVRAEVRAIDPNLAAAGINTMEQLVAGSLVLRRFSLVLFGVFAAIALLLAAVGIYGVMSYAVTERTHEIGVRLALGAQPRAVLRLVVREGATLALIGVGLGLAGAFALTRVMEGLLYGVSATDPITFTAIPIILIGVALGACAVPARRATKVDPMVALRYE